LLQDTKRPAEAELLIRRALAIDEQNFDKDHPKIANRLNTLVTLLQATNRLAEAEPLMRRSLKIVLKLSASTGYPHPNLQVALGNYYGLLMAMGHTKEQVRQKITDLLAAHGIVKDRIA
jgi:hypothetical protein